MMIARSLADCVRECTITKFFFVFSYHDKRGKLGTDDTDKSRGGRGTGVTRPRGRTPHFILIIFCLFPILYVSCDLSSIGGARGSGVGSNPRCSLAWLHRFLFLFVTFVFACLLFEPIPSPSETASALAPRLQSVSSFVVLMLLTQKLMCVVPTFSRFALVLLHFLVLYCCFYFLFLF